jgi:hypothetical protein
MVNASAPTAASFLKVRRSNRSMSPLIRRSMRQNAVTSSMRFRLQNQSVTFRRGEECQKSRRSLTHFFNSRK